MKQNPVKKVINDILVVGNEITEEKVIRNNLVFSEGDIFYQQDIDKSKDQIQATRIFKEVNITSIDNNDGKKVSVKVVEQPTGEISSGLGLGSAGSTVTFNLKENNFLGQGIYTNVGLNLGTQQVLGNITVNNPDYANTGNNLKNSLFVVKNNYDNAGYDNKIIGNNISTTSEIFRDIYFENGFGLSYDKISTTESASALISSQAGNYFSSKYFYDVTSDRRDRKFKPTSGYTLSFGQDIIFPPSDIPSLSNTIYGSLHGSLSEEFIGSIKYRLKSINSFNNDPVKLSDRVFVSDSELRGFSNRGIGPKINGDFVGGNYAFTSTIASTFPNGIPDSWNATTNVFFDVANVWGSDLSGVSESNKIRSSAGIGFTWISPIGPVSISYAEPVTKANTDDVQKFNFSIGSSF
jgi:outer membrane protein insertion porin family